MGCIEVLFGNQPILIEENHQDGRSSVRGWNLNSLNVKHELTLRLLVITNFYLEDIRG
jgi:hypothetical protein